MICAAADQLTRRRRSARTALRLDTTATGEWMVLQPGSAGLGFYQTGNLRPAFPVLLTSCRSRLPTRASHRRASLHLFGGDVANWSEMSNEEKLDYLLVTVSQIDHEVKRIEQSVFSVSTELTRRINDVLERLNKLSGDAQ